MSTEKKCQWAVNVFQKWQLWRNKVADMSVDRNLSPIRVRLLDMTKDEICFCLSRFVLEVKKENGEPYPSETVYEMLISIQLYFDMHGREMKFFSDPEFITLRNIVDTHMKQLASNGYKARRRQAEVIEQDEEEKLWEKGVLGDSTPQKLVDTVLYLFGLHFALRAGQEHRSIRFHKSQVSLQSDKEGLRYLCYNEDMSKTHQGGLKHRKIKPKTVRAYENIKNPQRCIVRLYEKYISHRPTNRKCSPAFYLRPLSNPVSDVWYSCQPIGINTISKTVSRICKNAGLHGFRTNHSLRATAASRLYHDAFDEQLICETTGHRSLAVRAYKRTNDGQKKKISNTLYGPANIPGTKNTHQTSKVRADIPSTSTDLHKSKVEVNIPSTSTSPFIQSNVVGDTCSTKPCDFNTDSNAARHVHISLNFKL